MGSQNVIFQKSQKLLNVPAPRKTAYSEHSIAIPNSISMVGYVAAGLIFLCGVYHAREVSSFCVLFYINLRCHCIFCSSLTQANFWVFFIISLIKSTIAYLCPKKINFHAVVLVSVALKKFLSTLSV